MVCIEYLYYFQKRWDYVYKKNGIQVVPFMFSFLETNEINESSIDPNSIFRLIVFPDEVNSVNYLFTLRDIGYVRKNISRSLADRYLPSKELMYQTSQDGDNLLNVDDNIIVNLLQERDNIKSGNPPSYSSFDKPWIKHTLAYWDFMYNNSITYSYHNSILKTDFLCYSISYLSLCEQIYYLLTKNIPELP